MRTNRFSQPVTPYQQRLCQLIQDAQKHHARPGEEYLSIRGLARLMGTPSANIKIGRWRSHRVLAKEITLESVEMLSRIDPEGRTAEEIQFWLRTGISISVGSYPEIKLFRRAKADLKALLSKLSLSASPGA